MAFKRGQKGVRQKEKKKGSVNGIDILSSGGRRAVWLANYAWNIPARFIT